MKKTIYNVMVALLAIVTVMVIAIGLTNGNWKNEPIINVVNQEVEDEINRIYKGMAEESVDFYNAYGVDDATVLYNVEG